MKKLTGEIAKINKILLMVNNVITRLDNIEEDCHNDFSNISSEFTLIKTSIGAL